MGTIGEAARPVGEGSGPLSDDRSRGMLSPPSNQGAGSVRDSSVGSMRSGPVRELNAGPGRDRRPMSGDGSIGGASTGAARQPNDSAPPQARPITDSELIGLEQQLRDVEPVPDAESAPGFEAAPEALEPAPEEPEN